MKNSLISAALCMSLLGCAGEETMENRVIPVTVEVMEPSVISETVYAPCRLEAGSDAVISVSVPGVVEEVLVSSGDTVQAGQRLLVLRTDDLQRARVSDAVAMLTAARAVSEYAGNNLRRAEELVETGAMSVDEFDRIQTEALASEATYHQAAAGYNASTTAARNGIVHAPFAGIVGRIIASEGNPASGPLMSVFSTGVLEAELLVAPRHIYRLREGIPAIFTTFHFPGQVFTGSVVSVSETVDPLSGLVAMRAQFTDTSGVLVPGLSGSVMLLLSTSDNAVVLPGSMMTPAGDSMWEVVVLQDGKTTTRQVQSGIRNGNRYEIISGLAPGDSVVNLGHTLVSEGTSVRVVQ